MFPGRWLERHRSASRCPTVTLGGIGCDQPPEGRQVAFGVVLAQVEREVGDPGGVHRVERERSRPQRMADRAEHLLGAPSRPGRGPGPRAPARRAAPASIRAAASRRQSSVVCRATSHAPRCIRATWSGRSRAGGLPQCAGHCRGTPERDGGHPDAAPGEPGALEVPARLVCAGAPRENRRARPDLHAHRRRRRSCRRTLDLHGRNDRGRLYPAPCDRCEPRVDGRNRARHFDVRRSRAGVGDCATSARHQQEPHVVCDALFRVDAPRAGIQAARQRASRRGRAQGSIVFLHSVEDGPANQSYGLQVAQLAGVPAGVIRAAKKHLHQLEQDGAARGRQPDLFAAPVAPDAAPAIDPELVATCARSIPTL